MLVLQVKDLFMAGSKLAFELMKFLVCVVGLTHQPFFCPRFPERSLGWEGLSGSYASGGNLALVSTENKKGSGVGGREQQKVCVQLYPRRPGLLFRGQSERR